MKNKRLSLIMAIMLMGIVLLQTSCTAVPKGDDSNKKTEATASKAPRLQDDFYNAVNYDWIQKTVLVGDELITSPIADMMKNVDSLLKSDLEKTVADSSAASPYLKEPAKLYTMLQDYDARNAEGNKSYTNYFKEIDDIDSISDLFKNYKSLFLKGYSMPINIDYYGDVKDFKKNSLYVLPPSTSLADASSYEDEDNIKEYKDLTKKLFVSTGYSEDQIEKILDDTIAFDKLIIPYEVEGETAADLENDSTALYKPSSFAEFDNSLEDVDFASIIKSLTGVIPEDINVLDAEYFKHISEIYKDENLPLIKNWMKSQFIRANMSYVSPETQAKIDNFKIHVGAVGATTIDIDLNYFLISILYSDALGQYYGETYLDDKSKADVENMTQELISIYRDRIKTIDWLSENTKEKAILKLDNMEVLVGYPDNYVDKYDNYSIKTFEQGGSVLSNVIEMEKIALENHWVEFGKTTPRDTWHASPKTVNAFAAAGSNSITIPAGIIQPPMYDSTRTKSQNYGALGVIIGHEISHIFDDYGAKFDEFGNVSDWWTTEDYDKFSELSQKMVKQFDGLEYADGTIDGEKTLSENIADLGGIGVAIDAVKKLPDGNLEEFFTSFAETWKEVSGDIGKEAALMDSHSPSMLRVNNMLPNFDEFYEVFNVKEGDAMYRSKSERLRIW